MRVQDAMLCAVIAASLTSLARAQVDVHVTRIVGPDSSAIESTDAVELIKFGSTTPSRLKQGDQLEMGDELRAKHNRIVVVVACLDNEFTLDSTFRVVIMRRPAGKPCYLDLYAGAAHVLGDSATGLGAGDVMLGAKRTHYAVTVSRGADGIRHELQVFEGEVEVRSTGRDTLLSQGFALAIRGSNYRLRTITPDQVRAAARLYAQVDASRVDRSTRPAATRSLSEVYQQVLARPNDNAARIDLVAAQVTYGVSNRGTLRQIERVTATEPPNDQLAAATTALSAAVYTQLGDHEQAAARYQTLRAYDSSAVNAALRAHRIDARIIERVVAHLRPATPHDVEERIDRPGNDLRAFALSEGQPLLCRSACMGDSRCRAWTYVRPGVQGPTAQCYLKSAVGQPQPNVCCTSGVNRNLEDRVDRPGNDFRAFALSGAQPLLCRSACMGDSRCRAWTYVRPGVQGPAARCYLKSAAGQSQPNSCCTSGVIVDEESIDRPGNDIRVFPLSEALPPLCRSACMNDARCRAWTYVRPGIQGPTAQCYLKSALGEPRMNPSCTSGVVHR